jgi:hypothetical protein
LNSRNKPLHYVIHLHHGFKADARHGPSSLPARTVNILAILQIVSSFLSIISPILFLFFVGAYGRIELSFAGIWCGVFFGISGFMGCLAARYPSSGRIVGFMVMSVISSCFCLPLLILPAIGIVNVEHTRMTNSRNTRTDVGYTHKDEALLALNVIKIFLALITAIVAITLSNFAHGSEHAA